MYSYRTASLLGRRRLTRTMVGVGHTLRLCFIEARPVVLFVFALRFTVGGVVSGAAIVSPIRAIDGEVSWFLAVWAVYLVNGISDLETDRRNGSLRPLASGRLPSRPALLLTLALATCAVLCASLVDALFCASLLAMLVLGVAYSVGPFPAKNWALPALFVAAGGAFLTYVSGAETFGDHISGTSLAFAAIACAWIAVVGHAKDFADVDGDKLAGRKTLPIVLGDRPSRWFVSVGGLTVGAVSMVAALSSAALLSVAIMAPTSVLVAATSLGRSSPGRRGQQRPYRVFMAAQYGVNVAALIVALTFSTGGTG